MTFQPTGSIFKRKGPTLKPKQKQISIRLLRKSQLLKEFLTQQMLQGYYKQRYFFFISNIIKLDFHGRKFSLLKLSKQSSIIHWANSQDVPRTMITCVNERGISQNHSDRITPTHLLSHRRDWYHVLVIIYPDTYCSQKYTDYSF